MKQYTNQINENQGKEKKEKNIIRESKNEGDKERGRWRQQRKCKEKGEEKEKD